MSIKSDEAMFTSLIKRLMDSFYYLARNILREEKLSLPQYYAKLLSGMEGKDKKIMKDGLSLLVSSFNRVSGHIK